MIKKNAAEAMVMVTYSFNWYFTEMFLQRCNNNLITISNPLTKQQNIVTVAKIGLDYIINQDILQVCINFSY